MLINLNTVQKNQKVAIALGYFDAIHLGHQSLFSEVVNSTEAVPSVFTFRNSIYKFLGKDTLDIYTFEERCRLMYLYGIKNIYYLDAAPHILSLSGKQFLEMLTEHLDISLIVAGEDYRYGNLAKCGVDELAEYSKRKNYSIIVKPLVMHGKQKISSSEIRNYLTQGDMSRIRQAIGRYYSVSGKVMHGRKSGKTIGYPTVNIPLNSSLQSPKHGVYVSNCIIDGVNYRSITNVGPHPTFADYSSNIETFIIDFDKDLYHKSIIVELVEYMRQVQSFCSIEKLKAQINSDVRYRESYND